jgi:hypothetical protein
LKLRIPGWAKGATATVNGAPVAIEPIRGYAPLKAERADLFGGVTILKAPAKALVAAEGDPLYSAAPPKARDATLAAIPYFLWANREPGSMQAWIAEAVA